jgi:hypothetical protein
VPTASYKERLKSLPEGSNYGYYKKSRYLVTKSTLLNNKLIKLYAIELGGNDLVSGNYYTTIKNGLLKPCEMSDEKVIDFILNVEMV